ncbi:MAG: hypothetical protein DMF68_16520 [Acidobacteria bacterium]|nr:MAG: hypothetical protein DMF68_16520 [Acidobacteriota bacterium]
MAFNGGPTKTHLLLPGSPAINAGDNTLAKDQSNNALTTDERGAGFSRVVNTTVDIGAVEVNYSIAASAGTPQSAVINNAFATNLQATVKESNIARSGISVIFTAPLSGATGTFSASSTVTTDSSGVATAPAFTANSTTGGYNVTASLTGGSPSTTFALTNTKADQTIIFNALTDKTFGDADFGVSATATSSLPVSFSATGNCTVTGSTVHITGAGTCTITASQTGDINFNAALPVSRSFNISKANQTITFGSLSNKTFGDANFNVSAAASSSLSVSFAASGQCTVTGSTVHITGAGSCTITASQSGSSNFNAATNIPQSFQIAKANQTITFGALLDKSYGAADFNISATASSSLSVSFSASVQCTVTGTTVHITGAGSCKITASQAGDSNYNAAASVDQTFAIAKATTTTTVASSANPSNFGQSVTFTATVASTAGIPTGTVQFKDGVDTIGAAVNCVAATGNSCTAQVSTSGLTSGTHTITASYGGDTNFAISTGTLAGGQAVNVQAGLSINDVSLPEGNSGTTPFTFTIKLSQASNLLVKVDYATADGTATAGSDYQATSGTLVFNPGDTTRTITVLVNGDTSNEPDETFFINLANPQNATLAGAQATGTIQNDDAPGIQFAQSAYSINENAADAVITVTRSGDLSQPATVNYATSDLAGLTPCNVANGIASQRCDYAITVGMLKFAAGESSKNIFIPIIDDAYTEGPETFIITLSSATGASLGLQSTATITIVDNDTMTGVNPIGGNDFFIHQQYIDFLDREPDPPGFAGWQNILTNCGATVQQPCDRIEVSSDFYRSQEFQDRGYFIYRFYETLGRVPHYSEFIPDMARVSGFLTTMDLETTKMAFVQDFMNRQEFQMKYGALTDPTAYVNALLQAVGIPNHPQRTTWISGLTNGTLTRGQVLRQLIESAEVSSKFYNEAFVVEAYFGYLRRDPDILYLQWLQMLNQTGDYRTLVNGFVNSLEYAQRFGP